MVKLLGVIVHVLKLMQLMLHRYKRIRRFRLPYLIDEFSKPFLRSEFCGKSNTKILLQQQSQVLRNVRRIMAVFVIEPLRQNRMTTEIVAACTRHDVPFFNVAAVSL